MNFPLVSILIPSYNHSNYIVETLNSILEDTYPNKEIIIIDDGSSDESVMIIQRWIIENKKKVDIKFINRSNKGLCYTLNEMLKLSKGKYIQLLASDDMLYGDNIKYRVEKLENLENEGVLALLTDAIIIDSKGNSIESSYISKYFPNIVEKIDIRIKLKKVIIKSYFVCAPSVLINRKIYEIIGYYNEKLIMEDKFFYIEAALKDYLYYINLPVVKYRIHSNNTSGSHISLLKKIKLTKSEILGYFNLFYKHPRIYFLYKILFYILYFLKLKLLFFLKK